MNRNDNNRGHPRRRGRHAPYPRRRRSAPRHFNNQVEEDPVSQAEEGVSRPHQGLAPSHLSYSSSSVASSIASATTDAVTSQVFVVAATIGSITTNSGSGGAARASAAMDASR